MQELMISIMNQFGYLGILFLIAIENIFPPIPSEVILTFGGFMTTMSDLHVFGVILFATIGSVIGALVLFSIGYLIKPEKLMHIVDGKWGKRLHLKSSDIAHAQEWFLKRGKGTVFFCRFIPIIRSMISIPAGMAQMRLTPFILLTTLGSFIWNIVLVYAGKLAGDHWETIVGYVSMYSKVALVVLILAFVVWIIWMYRKKRVSQ